MSWAGRSHARKGSGPPFSGLAAGIPAAKAGYWLVQALQDVASRPAACLVSRTIVRAGDPAFADPAKFVGPVYDHDTALRLAAEHSWAVRQDGAAWRRVVPSPEPLGADALLLLTDVSAVMDDYGTAQARPVRRATSAELQARIFPAGSMGPKVEAACRFVNATGGIAAIGRLDDAAELLDGTAGTLVRRPDLLRS